MPPYSQETHEGWENALLEEVKRTVKEVWAEAGRPRRVLLAVDGVVPMAKIRQQRVRRFKSSWLSASDAEETWDKNAITPGTEFMDVKLTRALKELVSQHNSWELSSVHEPGEGEHKVMRWIRENAGGLRSVVVYGLDADLILLSMITASQTGVSISLLREKQEFGGVSTNSAGGAQEYQTLVLEELVKRIGIPSTDLAGILNYVALMSLMGNDFLPHSLTHSLNEDGHDCVLAILRAGRRLVDQETSTEWTVNRAVALKLMAEWAREEDGRIVHTIKKKREQAVRGVGKGMEEREGLPLEWNVEEAIFPGRGARLVEDWREIAWDLWIHPGSRGRQEIRRELCESYLFGCQWIIDYYTGQKQVDLLWIFPSWLPPFWSDFAGCGPEASWKPAASSEPTLPLTSSEQLAMVLPLSSWGLVRDRAMRRLPAQCPQMWPTRFGFLSAGRKWLWQCEALVPVLTAERLRGELAASQ